MELKLGESVWVEYQGDEVLADVAGFERVEGGVVFHLFVPTEEP